MATYAAAWWTGALRPGLRAAAAWSPHACAGVRGMAVGKRGVPKQRREALKDKESRERRKELAREAKARNATDMDKHVLQAYKVVPASHSAVQHLCVGG